MTRTPRKVTGRQRYQERRPKERGSGQSKRSYTSQRSEGVGGRKVKRITVLDGYFLQVIVKEIRKKYRVNGRRVNILY